MTWLAENPIMIALFGGGLAVMCVVGWVQTGRRGALIAAAVAALATAMLTTFGVVSVTPREQIRVTLEQMAVDAASPDVSQLMRHIASNRDDLRRRAESALSRYRIEEVRITRVHEITVYDDARPLEAIARFNVVGKGGTAGGAISGQNHPAFVELNLVLEDGAWRITGYSVDEFTRGLSGDR